MPLSRRGLFGVLAAAPAAAVGMVALPAKGEPTDSTELDNAFRMLARVEAQRLVGPIIRRETSKRQGDWRAR